MLVVLFGALIFQTIKNYKIKEKKKYVIGGWAILIAIGIATTCVYTVDQTDYAVISTFGRPNTEIVSSGLKLKLPSPIQKVDKLSKETFSTTIGYSVSAQDQVVVEDKEAQMITGDENIILADLEIQWKIDDPIAFLYNTNDPRTILHNATSSSLRGVVGSSMVDDVLTDGRAKIITDIRDNLSALIEEYKLGISIINVNLQDVDLPTVEVDSAFKAVTDAREERLTKINNAEKYRNEKINEVKGEKDAILSKAEATSVSLVEKAKGDTARFNAVYTEYAKNKDITKQRLITDTLNAILKDATLYITDGADGTMKYLPINQIKEAK
ncbi:MAG TPA: FtsH protease activity modulator HflK [Epulopiscium sp.]|nr:FtsH protease activity modulator HflK [Candidatus Epulonipiscium sp.]